MAFAEVRRSDAVKPVKLGKKGQVTIPKMILRSSGATDGMPVLVEANGDGCILLGPATVSPVERYADRRVAELERENTGPDKALAKVDALIARKKRR